MMQAANNRQRSAFGWWLRTGRLPPAPSADGLELKFNSWHDPADGRFTFAGSGRRYGAGEGGAAKRPGVRAPVAARHDKPSQPKPKIAALPRPGAARADQSAADGKRTADRGSVTTQPNPAAEFVGGVGEGLYGVAEETVAGVYSALTTNPLTTIGNVGRGVAGMIDTAIATEDTPARVQIARGADAIANASARDVGRVTGSVVGNVALMAVPQGALSKVSATRALARAKLRPTFDPPQIGWVKETVRSDEPWKAYNDSAAGSRSGQAPTLMRTMADGSKRPVKFDGIQGDYVIDRKWSVRDMSRARAQVLRQSQVLAEHRLIGMWEVPTPVQKAKALKLLNKMNITNIHVKVVKP